MDQVQDVPMAPATAPPVVPDPAGPFVNIVPAATDKPVTVADLTDALSAMRAPDPRGPKLRDPPSFGGNIRESQDFLYHVLANLASDHARYNTVQKKILYFTSFLKDSALKWFLGLLRRNADQYIKAENAVRAASFPPPAPLVFDPNFQFDSTLYEFVIPELLDWQTFLRFFNATFDDPDRRATAERKLKSLVQKTSVAAYAAEYQSYCYELDDTPRRIAENFYNGLKTYVKDEVHQRGKPHTLEAMIALAVIVDNRLMERKLERDVEQRLGSRGIFPSNPSSTTTHTSALRTSGPPPASRTNGATTFSQSRPAPRVAATTNPRPSATAASPITPEERQRRFDAGLCIYCGKPGHIKRDCPIRPPRPNVRVASTRATTTTSASPTAADSGNSQPRD